jgi:hypothetical protein
MTVTIQNQMLLNLEEIPNIRFVHNDDYMSDYNIPTDTVSVNINPKYKLDNTYLTILGIIESSRNPSRGLFTFNKSVLYNIHSESNMQGYNYFVWRIHCNLGALLLLSFMGKWSAERHRLIYSSIKEAASLCWKNHHRQPKVNMTGVYRMCAKYIHNDSGGKNRSKLNRLYSKIRMKLQRDFFDNWEGR